MSSSDCSVEVIGVPVPSGVTSASASVTDDLFEGGLVFG